VTASAEDHAASLPDFDPAALTDVDVRDDLQSGREPLTRVLALADALPEGGVLHVRAPFQPTPLFQMMAKRGFAHRCEAFATDDWSTWFWRSPSPPVRSAVASSLTVVAAPPGVIDLRRLPPPEPLVAILAQITRSETPFEVLLPFDAPILAALLAEQGWQIERIDNQTDGVWLRLSPAAATP
jgi:hypothetical protein